MVRTRTTPGRGATSSSRNESANATSKPQGSGERGGRRDRKRVAPGRRGQAGCDEGDPGAKRKRGGEPEDLAGESPSGEHVIKGALRPSNLATCSGTRTRSATHSVQDQAVPGGSGRLSEEQGAREGQQEPEVSPASKVTQWGSLISQYPQHPHVSLTGSSFTIGRSKDCSLSFSDCSLNGQLCSLSTEDRIGRAVMLTCHSGENVLSVNGRLLKKDEKVEVKGGDEVNIVGSCPYSYIFQHLDVPQPVPATVTSPGSLVVRVPEQGLGDGSLDDEDITHLAGGVVPLLVPATSAVLNVDAEAAEASQTHAGNTTGESRENKGVDEGMAVPSNPLKWPEEQSKLGGSLACSPVDFPIHQAPSGSPPGQISGASGRLSLNSGRLTIVRGLPSRAGSLPNAQDSISVLATMTNGAMDWAPDNHKTNKHIEHLRDEFHECLATSGSIDVTLDSCPYFLGEGLKERLLQTAFIHFKCPQYKPYVSDLSCMSSKILLTGPTGSSRCQETLVRAIAKEMGASVLTFDKSHFGVEGNQGDQDCEQDLGLGAVDACDEIDFFDDLEGKGPGSSGAEGLSWRNMFGNSPTSGPARKKSRVASGVSFAAPGRCSSGHSLKDRKKNSQKSLKKGDRVVYSGQNVSPVVSAPGLKGTVGGPSQLVGIPPMAICSGTTLARRDQDSSSARGPWVGCAGKVVLTFPDSSKKVGVRFDQQIPGGVNLGNMCEDGHGFFCMPSELRPEAAGRGQEQEVGVIDAMFDVASEAAEKQPLIVVFKDVDKCVAGTCGIWYERYIHLKRRIDGLDGPVLVIGLYVNDVRRERPQGALFSRLGPHPNTLLELGFFDNMSRWEDKGVQRPDTTKVMKFLKRLLPNRIALCPPHAEGALAEWKKLMYQDMCMMREESNRQLIGSVLAQCRIKCTELSTLVIQDTELIQEQAERLVGLAVANALKHSQEPETQEGCLVVNGEHFLSAAQVFRSLQAELIPSRLSLKDVPTDSEYERRLLAEVVPPEEVGVGFDDIGALESVKRTLQEVVMLPLQRPELFSRGQLLKPTKGVLLFGPPGTGKTMLAKAVAAESGANFINVSVATVSSKWFGEGEKYVRALFSLAHKIAPSVIFIDEVDSLLGRRDKTGEHEAMRKIKNEFMSSWDGLKTKESDRVLVLAATNRPMDLDEAVIRRMPRRLLVDLPSMENRIKILRVILREEEVDQKFNYEELATLTDGYSGSDIKNLCLAAAFRPVRDFLSNEAKDKSGGNQEVAVQKDVVTETNAGSKVVAIEGQEEQRKRVLSLKPSSARGQEVGMEGSSTPSVRLRSITMQDLKEAMKQVGSSVAAEAMNMSDLRQWNEMYGEGGNRQSTSLSYFL